MRTIGRSGALLAAAALLALWVGCAKDEAPAPGQAEGSREEPTQEDRSLKDRAGAALDKIGEGLGEAAAVGGEAARAAYDEASATLSARLDRMERNIDAYEETLRKAGVDVVEEAEQALETLQERAKEARATLAAARDEAGPAVEAARDKAREAIERLERAYEALVGEEPGR